MSTGNIQWDYPELDVKIGDGDEMDICTTPPPNDEAENCLAPEVKKMKKGNDFYYLHVLRMSN